MRIGWQFRGLKCIFFFEKILIFKVDDAVDCMVDFNQQTFAE